MLPNYVLDSASIGPKTCGNTSVSNPCSNVVLSAGTKAIIAKNGNSNNLPHLTKELLGSFWLGPDVLPAHPATYNDTQD